MAVDSLGGGFGGGFLVSTALSLAVMTDGDGHFASSGGCGLVFSAPLSRSAIVEDEVGGGGGV